MRLSATDRIIREAELQDDAAVEAAEHPDTEKMSVTPFVTLGIPAPRMPTPLGGGVDIEIEDGYGQDDEEGETQVDAKRSAAALNEMRALQATLHAAAPATATRSDSYTPRGVPPGRPATPAFVTAVGGSAPTPPRLPGFTPPPAYLDDDRPDHMFSSSRIQFGAIAMPRPASTASGWTPATRLPGRVGRRTGLVIAASTAVAVALIAGAWTAKNATPLHTVISRPSSVLPTPLIRGATAATPPRPVRGPVVVATPPAAAPEPTETPPAPTMPEAATVPAPAPAADAAPIPTTTPTGAAPLSKRAQAAAAKKAAIKARVAKKKAALAAAGARRKTRAHQTTRTAVAAPATTARPTAPPPRSADAPRGRADPDDTLPITD
jgi:hypothetical protein